MITQLLIAGSVVVAVALAQYQLGASPEENLPMQLLGPGVTQEFLLPDIVPSHPRELYIVETPTTHTLRFSTTFGNRGSGPLELHAEHDIEAEVTHATQRLYREDGSFVEHTVGEFVFHPTHDHWHIENYVVFELWSISDSGEREELLTSTDKMSFCIWDEEHIAETIADRPEERVYVGCNNEVQGLSVGWSDTYTTSVDGQEISLEGIPDGSYIVRTHINPNQQILESDFTNNTNETSIEIYERIVSVHE